MSVAEKIKQFDKAGSPTNGTASSKVAELKARLEKSSQNSSGLNSSGIGLNSSGIGINISGTGSSSGSKPPVVPRSASNTKINEEASNTPTAAASKPAIVRSSSASTMSTSPPVANEVLNRSSSLSKMNNSTLEEFKTEEIEIKPIVSDKSSFRDKSKGRVNSEELPEPPEQSKINPRPSDLRKSSESSLTGVLTTKPSQLHGKEIVTTAEAAPTEPIVKAQSPTATSKLLLAADMLIPPTVEQQDYYVLWALSFVVPFFLLRFVFELVRRFVLGPIRLAVRHAPGGNRFLSFVYVKLGPVIVKLARQARERLPPMDSVNATAKAGLEKFLQTLQNAVGAAYPHLLHLADSIKTMRFREAAKETMAVLKAWAPMLLLLIPLTKNLIIAARKGWLTFWRVSKTAVYLPLGGFLRKAVVSFGKALTENPDVFAERVAGLLGPVVGFFVSFIFIFGIGLQLGLVNYETLSSMYIAWFFRLLGLVSEPSLLDNVAMHGGGDMMGHGLASSIGGEIGGAGGMDSATGAAAGAGAAAGQDKGFIW